MKSSDGSIIEVAIKAPKLGAEGHEDAVIDFYKEAKTSISLKHENIVRCLGLSKQQNELPHLLFEFMTHGSLDIILESHRTKNSPHEQHIKLTKVSSLLPFKMQLTTTFYWPWRTQGRKLIILKSGRQS